MKHATKILPALALAALTLLPNATRAATFGWSGAGTGAGSGAGTAWLTAGNWTNNAGTPTNLDLALFGSAGSGTSIGFNFNGPPATTTNIGAIVLGAGSTVDRTIGNSSTTAGVASYLYFSGIGGGLLTNAVAGRTLTLAPFAGGSGNGMTNILLASGNIHAVGTINVTGVLGEAGGARSLTKSGIGALILNTNSFTGTLTVNNDGLVLLTGPGAQSGATLNTTGVLRVAHSGALGTGNLTVNPNNAETGRLELSNNVSILSGRTLTLSGRNNATDAIRNVSGNNTIAGAISFTTGGGTYAVDSTSGTLTLSGGVTSTATGGRTLTLQGASTGTASAAIVNGSATMSLVKAGIGAWTLTANNAYSGVTTVSGGLLALSGSGSIANSPSIFVGTDSTLSVGAVTGGFSLASGQTLAGVGLVLGAVRAPNGSTVAAGTIGTAGTLQFANNFFIEDGASLGVDLASTTSLDGGTNDLLLVNGNLALSGVARVSFNFLQSGPALGVPYTLARYLGTLTGGAANLVATNCAYTATFDTATPGEVRVTFTVPPGGLVWNGSAAGLTSNVWDVAVSTNWLSGGVLSTFLQGHSVLFDDTAATQTVNLVSSVTPSNLTVNSSLNYLFQGAGGILGGNLVKDGSGTLTLSNAASYAGATLVSGGTVKVGNATALGNSSSVTVNGTGQIDLNGVLQAGKNYNYTISGAGPDGLGAIKSTVANISTSSGVKNLTLAADATIGSTLAGSGSRADFNFSGGVLNGGGNKLTKVGPGQLNLRGTTVNLAELIVNDGLLYAEDVDHGFGARLTINSGGIAGCYNNRVQSAEIFINNLGTLSGVGPSGAATTVYTGPVTLTGDAKVDGSGAYGGANVTLTGPVGGAGALTKSGANILTMNGTNTYAGGTTISNGSIRGTTYALQGNITNYLVAGTQAGLQIDQSFDGTLNATVTGTGTFLKRGLGRAIIATPMTITGGATNEAGTIALGADNALGASAIDCRGAGGLFPAFESADASTRTLNNLMVISTDTRFGSAGSGNLVFSGPINNGGGVKSLTVSNALTTFTGGMTNTGPFNKFGPGTLALGGQNNNTSVVISNGTVALISGGAFTNFPNLTLASGAVLDYSAGADATFTNASGKTLIAGRTSGAGDDIIGSLISTGTVTLAAAAVPATLTINGNASFGGGTLNFDLGNTTTVGGGVSDLLTNNGTLTLAGTIALALNAYQGSLANGTYTLMQSAGVVANTATFTVTGTNGWRQNVSVIVTANELTLSVAGSPLAGALTWLGTNVNWDLATTNWLNGLAQDRFFPADAVLFDNSSTNTNVVVAVTVQPSTVTVNSSSNYAFSGAGKISGGASYIKSGTGTNLVSLANDYIGQTFVNGGMYKMGNASALGATSAPGLDAGTVINGGSVDLNGLATITESFTVQGAGLGGHGAMVNNGAAIVNGGPRARVTLSGDTTFGAPARWDLQGGATLAGNGFKVTKVGGAEMFMSGLGETAVGDIDVRQGFFTWGGNSTPGDPTKTYNVAGFALLNFFAHTVPFNKMLTLQSASTVQNGSGTAILAGPITLAGGGAIFNLANVVIVSNVISGPGVLVKQGASTLTLLMTNANTGNTFVGAGTLGLGNGVFTAILPGAITNNGTVDLNPAYLYPLTNFITGSGTLTKSGTNTAFLAGDFADQLGNLLTLNVTGGSFDLNGRAEVVRALAGNAGTTVSNSAGGPATLILANPSGNQTYSGSIIGNVQVVVRDAATKNTTLQTFAGTNTFTGRLIIDNGQLRVANDAFLGAIPSGFDAPNVTIRNGGLLQNNNSYVYLHPNRGIFLESGDGGFMAGFSRDITVLGVISGPGRLVKADGGRLLLANANTFTGDTVFQNIAGAGTLRLDHPLALMNSTFDATGIGANGTLDLNFLDVTLGGLKGNGATIANFTGRLAVGGNGQSTTFGGALSGSGSLVKVGSGVLDLTGANTASGGTTISNGTLNVAGSLAGGTVTVRAGAGLGGFGNVNAHVVADPGALVYPGASVGTLTISSNATFNGATLLFELASLTTIDAGVNDFIQVNGALNLTGLNVIRFGFLNGAPSSGTYTLIRYTGALTGGAANLAAVSSYGATFDTSVPGEVRVTFTGAAQDLTWRGDGAANAWDLNSTSNFFNGTALDRFRDGDSVIFDDIGSNNVPVALSGLLAPADFTVNAGIDYTFAGPGKLATPRGLTKLGSGKLTLANTNDTFGPLNILGGVVAISADENLGNVPPLATPGRVVLNGGSLQAAANLTLHPNRGLALGPASGNGGGAIDVPGGNTLLYGGVIGNNGGAGSLIKSGAGTLILSGSNVYSGNTIVSQGRILARNATAFGAGGAIVLGDANSGADPIIVLLDTATNGASLTVTRDIVVTSSGTGPVIVGSTARFGFPGAEQAIFNGIVTLNGRDLVMQTGAGDFTRFNGIIQGTGNLIITNGSLTGDTRGNGGNRILLENTPKTFAGNVNVLAGSTTNFTVLQIGGGGNTYDFIPDGANVTVQTNAVLRLFGHEAINGLSGNGRVRGVVNQYVLTVGSSNATSTFDGVMENDPFDGGSLAFSKVGSGAFTLNSVSAYTGPTIVGGGSLVLGAGAAISNSAGLTLSNGTTLDATALGGLTLRNNQILSSFGAVAGGLTAISNTTINPGFNGVAGTLTVGGNLSLSNASRVNIDLGGTTTPGGGVNDLIAVTGDLALSTAIVTVNAAGPLAAGSYTLITYTGARTGGASSLTLVNNTGRSGLTLDDSVAGEIRLVVATAGATLVWSANATNGFWDLNTTTNWLNAGLLDRFLQGDAVAFDSTSVQTNVTNNATLTPSVVTLSGATNYNFFGTGKISGSASLVVNSSGTNTMTLTGNNDFNGPVTISAGVLRAGNGATLGSVVGGTLVSSGATLDVNGQNLGAEIVTASGAGVAGQGAIVNNGASQTQPLRFVTLAGDTTFGGVAAGRWDIRGPNAATPAALSSGGQPYKLTKIGGNQFSLVNAQVDPALGDVDVLGGIFSIEVGTTGLGDPARTLAIGTNASLQFFNLQVPLNKNLVLSNNAVVINNSGANAISGPVTLVGSNIFNVGGTSLAISNSISGAGTLSKIGGSPLILNGNNPYAGGTVLGGGTTILSGNNDNGGGALINSGSTLQLGNGTPGGNVSGLITNNGTLQFFRPDAFTFSASVVGAGTVLQPSGSGPVTLSGNMTNANLTIRSGNTSVLTVGPGNYSFTNVTVGNTPSGWMNILSGVALAIPGNYFVGDASGGQTGIVVQTGGDLTVGGQFRLAHWPNNVSTYLMGGGSLTMTTFPASNPVGQSSFEQNGGFYIGIDGVGIFTQTGGVVNTHVLGLDNRGGTALGVATNTYALEGGTINLGSYGMKSGASTGTDLNTTYQINLGGGTVGSLASWGSVLTMNLTGNRGNVTFNPGSFNNVLFGVLYGSGGLTKAGAGSLILSNASTFTGHTLITGGTLALLGPGGLASSANITVGSGAFLDATAKTGGFTVGAAQTLRGNGTVLGLAAVAGTVAPGTSIGTLTFDSPLTLAGTTLMEIDRGAGQNADLIVAPAVTNGGALVVTNVGAALVELDAFNLFDATTFSGAFASVTLPPLPSGLAWDLSSLYVDGAIRVVAPPTFAVQPTNAVAQCGGGATFSVVVNGSAPLSYQWRSNGVDIAGANAASLTLNGLNTAAGGSFEVVVANGGGTNTSAAATLAAVDTLAPVFTCSSNLVVECTSSNGVVVNFTVTAADACDASPTLACVPASGSTFALGTNSVTCTAYDAAFNTNTCAFTVAVIDSTPPDITACATNRTLSANTNCQLAIPDLTAEVAASDFCSDLIITQSPAAGTLVGLGATNVTLTVVDAASNTVTCVAVLTVADTTPPVIVSCAPATNLVADVNCTAPAPDLTGLVSASDCHGPVTVTQDPAAGASLGLGANVVTLFVVDAANNTNTCTATVTVVDQTPPTILACASDQTLTADLSGMAIIPDLTGQVTYTDNCGPVTVTQSPAAGTVVGLGDHVITLSATDAATNADTCLATVTVSAAPVAPSIVNEPPDQAAPCTSNATFTVLATGTSPLSYQWYFNSNPISDATNATLALNAVRPAQAGGYQVIVTNYLGGATSRVAVLTIVDATPPAIVCSSNLVVKTPFTSGTVVNFSATATDTCDPSPALTCAPASGSLFPVGLTTVTCAATDINGNSNVCTFAVNVLLAGSSNAVVNTDVPDGSSLGLASVIQIASPIGALTDVNVTLNVSNGWNGDLFAYLVHDSGYVVLLNRAGKRLTDPLGYDDAGFNVTLDDQAADDIHNYRLALFSDHGTPLAGPLTGAWKPDGRAIDPAFVLDTDPRTALLSSFNGLNPNGEWALFVQDDATGDVSKLVSWSLELCGTAGVAPVITNQPQSVAAGCGDNVSFTVGASGTGPVGYHWRQNGAPVAGANGPTLALNGVLPAQAGNYSVIVSNAFGSVTSSVVTLTVSEQLPVIVTQPQSRTNLLGTAATLSVTAISCSPLSYQWCLGANPIADATNAMLIFASVQLGDAGSYSVKLSNAAGSVTSAVAVLTVNRAPVAGDYGAATTENRPVSISVAKLLSVASDADGDPLTVGLPSATSTNGGAVTLGGGSVTYTPRPGFHGLDRFSITVSDGRGGFDTGDVQVLVVDGSLPGLNQVSIMLTPGGVLVRFAGVPGYTYHLQRAPAVNGPWSTIAVRTAPIHGIIEYEDTPAMGAAFYRTVAP